MTSFRQNGPNLFPIRTVHIINFYNMTSKTNLIKVPHLLLHKQARPGSVYNSWLMMSRLGNKGLATQHRHQA